MHSNRAKEGRERKLDWRGRSSGGQQWRPAGAGPIRPGKWHERAQRGAVEVEGEVNRLGVRAIKAERRGGGRLDEDARKEKGMRTRSLQSLRTDKARAEGEVCRRSRRVEVAGAVTVTGMASGRAQ